jgi:hypothetical protein
MLIQRGHMPPPDPEGPGVFSMASEARTRALLQSAGFTKVRTENTPVRWSFRDVDEYVSFATDTGGPFAIVLRALPESELKAMKAQLREAFVPFATNGGYELPGVALNAVAS